MRVHGIPCARIFGRERKMLNFNMEEISSILNDINLITKVKFDLYDENFKILHGENKNMCRFCSTVRTCPESYKKCLESDRIGFERSKQSGAPCTYKCHMGLSETVTPIVCDGSVVGYIMMGQKLMREDFENVKANVERIDDNEKRELLLAELGKMKYTEQDELNAICNLVQMCASYLRMKKLIKFRETPPKLLMENYVEEHLADELDIKKLCREFKMSKSSLYALSQQSFSKGITDYIRDRRMEKAKELLVNTDDSVSTVAASVGYVDPNYFTKVFKKYTEMTPCEWRKKQKGEMDEK